MPKILPVLSALFLFLAAASAYSQSQPASSPKASDAAPNNLILEVTYCKCRPPAYQVIPHATAKGAFHWYGAFPRVSGWKQPAGVLPVQAVNILPHMNGDSVKVRVSVFTGVSSHEKEEFVGEYAIREGGRTVVKDLAAFGVEPFELAVVRAAQTAGSLPFIVNKTKSLQVTVEPYDASIPSFKAVFYNGSSKPVAAFSYETTLNGQRRFSGMPQNILGRPLIPPDTPAEKIIRSSTPPVTATTGQTESAQYDFVLTVKSVVFTDGTYEGDAADTARFRAFSIGRKFQAGRIANLLQEVGKNEASAAMLDALKGQISGLGDEVEEAALTNLFREFPTLSEEEKQQLRGGVKLAAQDVRFSFVKEIEAKKKETGLTAETAAAWVAAQNEKHRSWYSALP